MQDNVVVNAQPMTIEFKAIDEDIGEVIMLLKGDHGLRDKVCLKIL